MPQNVAVAAFVFGAILFLLALLGGSFKLFGAEITGAVGKQVRAFSGIVGAIFIIIGLLNNPFEGAGAEFINTEQEALPPLSASPQQLPTLEPTVRPSGEDTTPVTPSPTLQPTPLPTSPPLPVNNLPPPPQEASDASEPNMVPVNAQCPVIEGAGWLTLPNFWYGPYSINGVDYLIGYDPFYIYVWNTNTGYQYWPDPGTINGRNQWLPLVGAPFQICVDQQGLVFAAIAP